MTSANLHHDYVLVESYVKSHMDDSVQKYIKSQMDQPLPNYINSQMDDSVQILH